MSSTRLPEACTQGRTQSGLCFLILGWFMGFFFFLLWSTLCKAVLGGRGARTPCLHYDRRILTN